MTLENKLLIPFFTAGFPKLESTAKVIEVLNSANSDYIEIGLAHSDALADGPVIQDSSHVALNSGINIEILFQQIKEIDKTNLKSKLILFSYYNPLLTYGLDKSCKLWKEAGGNSILVPDLPIEETNELNAACKKNGLNLIFLVAPTSTEERIAKIAKISEEFIYLVSVTGVTGVRKSNDKNQRDLSETIKLIKKYNPDIPIAIGFGIGDGESAQNAIKQGADGVVVGSAIVRLLKDENFDDVKQLLAEIYDSVN